MNHPVLIILLFSLYSTSAHAFTLISSLLHSGWDTQTLTFQVNESSCTAAGVSADSVNTAVDAAIELWNKAPTSGLKLAKGATTTSTSYASDPVIYCKSTTQSNTVAGTGGITILSNKPYTGGLELNGDSTKVAYFGGLDANTQAMIVAHEIGHVLGLGHTEKEYGLMYYDLSDKEHVNFSQDDIDGLTWLNPRDELSGGIMGCATIQEIGNRTPPTDGGGSMIINWILVLMIAFVASRRRNRNAANVDAQI